MEVTAAAEIKSEATASWTLDDYDTYTVLMYTDKTVWPGDALGNYNLVAADSNYKDIVQVRARDGSEQVLADAFHMACEQVEGLDVFHEKHAPEGYFQSMAARFQFTGSGIDALHMAADKATQLAALGSIRIRKVELERWKPHLLPTTPGATTDAVRGVTMVTLSDRDCIHTNIEFCNAVRAAYNEFQIENDKLTIMVGAGTGEVRPEQFSELGGLLQKYSIEAELCEHRQTLFVTESDASRALCETLSWSLESFVDRAYCMHQENDVYDEVRKNVRLWRLLSTCVVCMP